MKRLMVTGLTALLLAGCRVEFTAPDVAGPSTVVLSAAVHFRDMQSLPIGLSAQLRPGSSDDGRPRVVLDDTLRLDGRAVPPRETFPDGTRLYFENWAAAGVGLDDLRIETPFIDGVAQTPDPVTFGIFRRIGADTLVIALQDTVELRTIAGPPSSEPSRHTSWQLQLTTPGGLRLSQSGTELPPAVFRIPAAWLEWADGDPVTVHLNVLRSWEAATADGDYRMVLSVRSTLQWTLVWSDAENAAAP